MYVGVPTGPLMARMIWLRVDLRRNCLQHDHHPIALHDSPEVPVRLVSATSVSDFKGQLVTIKLKTLMEVVHNKKRGNAVQR